MSNLKYWKKIMLVGGVNGDQNMYDVFLAGLLSGFTGISFFDVLRI